MQVNFKPNAKRLELTAGLDLRGPNFNAEADPAKQLESLTLKSQSVDMPTTFALASLKGDRLVLSPLTEALQMRPQLSHLDSAKKKAEDEEEEEEEEKKPEFLTVCNRCCACCMSSIELWRSAEPPCMFLPIEET